MTAPNKWLVLNCPLCGFRFPLRKFAGTLKPILFPLGFASSRGRARGFATIERLPWSALPSLQNTDAWNSVLNLYGRLAAAYDHFYITCGFMSPRMTALAEELRKSYADSYLTNPFPQYAQAYPTTCSDIAEAYTDTDYSKAYALHSNESTEVT
jgi:hypothetical protein